MTIIEKPKQLQFLCPNLEGVDDHADEFNYFLPASLYVISTLAASQGKANHTDFLLLLNKCVQEEYAFNKSGKDESGSFKVTYKMVKSAFSKLMDLLLDMNEPLTDGQSMNLLGEWGTTLSMVMERLSDDSKTGMKVEALTDTFLECGGEEKGNLLDELYKLSIDGTFLTSLIVVDVESGCREPSRMTKAASQEVFGFTGAFIAEKIFPQMEEVSNLEDDDLSADNVWDVLDSVSQSMKEKATDKMNSSITRNCASALERVKTRMMHTDTLHSIFVEESAARIAMFGLFRDGLRGKVSGDELRSMIVKCSEEVNPTIAEYKAFIFSNVDIGSILRGGGEYKNFWDFYEEGKQSGTWHNNYSADASVGRAINECRLFGEATKDITYGCILHEENDKDKIARLQEMYGENYVTIDIGRIFKEATITLGDSSLASHAFTLTPCSLANMLYTLFMKDKPKYGEYRKHFNKIMFDVSDDHDPFIEVQIHRKITVEDID